MRPSFSLMVGSSIFIEVNVSGQPRPSVCWFHNDAKVEETNRVSTETAEGWSSLKVKASTAEDAGSYKVTAENAAGFDSAEFKVLVKGLQVFVCFVEHKTYVVQSILHSNVWLSSVVFSVSIFFQQVTRCI